MREGNKEKREREGNDLELIDKVDLGERSDDWNNKSPIFLNNIGADNEKATLLARKLRHKGSCVRQEKPRAIAAREGVNKLNRLIKKILKMYKIL